MGERLPWRRDVSFLDRPAHDPGHGHVPGDRLSRRRPLRPRYRLQSSRSRRRQARRAPLRELRPEHSDRSPSGQSLARRHLRLRPGRAPLPLSSPGEYAPTSSPLTRTPRGTSGSAPCATPGSSIPPIRRSRPRQEARHRRQILRPRRDQARRLHDPRDGHVLPPAHHLPLPLRRRPAHRQRRPGREQDRARPDLRRQDAKRSLSDRHQRRRPDEPQNPDLERPLAAHVPRIHHGMELFLRRGAPARVHVPVHRRGQRAPGPLLADEPQQLRRSDRGLGQRRPPRRHLPADRRHRS